MSHRQPLIARALAAVSDHLCFRPNLEGKPMAQNTITLRHIPQDGWEVVIIEQGERSVRGFENSAYALSYAEGQGVRLGVPVTRVGAQERDTV